MFVKRGGGLVFLLAALVGAGCQSTPYVAAGERPTPEQMRAALKTLLKEHPEYSLPEFDVSLDQPPVMTGSTVRFGSIDCDLDTLMFDASFSGTHLTLKELTG